MRSTATKENVNETGKKIDKERERERRVPLNLSSTYIPQSEMRTGLHSPSDE